MNLCLSVYGELFVINLKQVMYMQADDHYTHIFYNEDSHFMVPFGLAYIQAALEKLPNGEGGHLLRVGRKHIVNMDMIYHVNVLKRSISLSNAEGRTATLSVSTATVKNLVERMQEGQPDISSIPTQLVHEVDEVYDETV